MAYYQKTRPRRRGLTAAQQKAHDAAYEACDHTVTGRYARRGILTDGRGGLWRVATYGIRYHEDADSFIYGVQPAARGPKGWKESEELRSIRDRLLKTGGREETVPPLPDRADVTSVFWDDRTPDSLASYPTLTVWSDDLVQAIRPVYDDSAQVGWTRDRKLAARARKLISASPTAVHLPRAAVKERTVSLDLAPGDPRYAEYSAAEGAEVYARPVQGDPHSITLPRAAYRRIRARIEARGDGDL